MQISDTTNDTGLFQDIDFLCDTDSTSFPTKDKARLMNRWYYKVIDRIDKANRYWDYDDTNQTDAPIATATLVDAQRDYALPADLLTLKQVEVKNSSGDYEILKHVDVRESNTPLDELYETDGMPEYYDAIGESIYLYPAPATAQVTTAAGLRIHYTREVDAIAATDTTQQPGFAEPFHRILSLGASQDFFVKNGEQEKATALRAEIEALLNELDEFYGQRDKSVSSGIRPAHKRTNYE